MNDPNRIATDDHLAAGSEEHLLLHFFSRKHLSRRLGTAPGGWRTLSAQELQNMKLNGDEQRRVLALQELVSRGYPKVQAGRLASSQDVARIFGARLGGLVTETMIAVALDGQNGHVGEATVALGGGHGLAVTARDILRPMIRMGASAFIIVHNHPSGDPTPSAEDIAMTRAVAEAGDVVGLPLVDHVIVASRGRGFTSLLDLGFLDPESQRGARGGQESTINEQKDRI